MYGARAHMPTGKLARAPSCVRALERAGASICARASRELLAAGWRPVAGAAYTYASPVPGAASVSVHTLSCTLSETDIADGQKIARASALLADVVHMPARVSSVRLLPVMHVIDGARVQMIAMRTLRELDAVAVDALACALL